MRRFSTFSRVSSESCSPKMLANKDISCYDTMERAVSAWRAHHVDAGSTAAFGTQSAGCALTPRAPSLLPHPPFFYVPSQERTFSERLVLAAPLGGATRGRVN